MNLFSKKDVKTMTIAEQFVSKVEQEALSNKIRVYAPMILLVFMTIVFSIYDSHFFSMKNLINVLGQMAVPLILATGLTFVLLLGRTAVRKASSCPAVLPASMTMARPGSIPPSMARAFRCWASATACS